MPVSIVLVTHDIKRALQSTTLSHRHITSFSTSQSIQVNVVRCSQKPQDVVMCISQVVCDVANYDKVSV